jgi:hypothetical protein
MYLSYVLINQVMYIIFISAVFLEKMFVVVAKSLFTIVMTVNDVAVSFGVHRTTIWR